MAEHFVPAVWAPDGKTDTCTQSLFGMPTSTILSPQLKRLFNQSITINSTAFEDIDPETEQPAFVGSKTETALLRFAQDLGWENWKETHESAEIVQMIPFSSEQKAIGVVVRLCTGSYRLFLMRTRRGFLQRSTHTALSSPGKRIGASMQTPRFEMNTIDEFSRDNISRTIIFSVNQELRTIALCYQDF